MNRKQIETSREIRLWITGIVGPVVIGTATILASDPELLGQAKGFVKQKYRNIKTKILKKKETL